MIVARDVFLGGLLAAFAGPPTMRKVKPAAACPKPPVQTPVSNTGDVAWSVDEKIDLALSFAKGIVEKPALRDEMDKRVAWWRAQNNPNLECDLSVSPAHQLWLTYSNYITRATRDPRLAAKPLRRGDVADVLWVAANFFLSAATSVSGFDQMSWPPPSKSKHARARKPGPPAHMTPLPDVAGSNVDPCRLPFSAPRGIGSCGPKTKRKLSSAS